jgi:hypothetical protein
MIIANAQFREMLKGSTKEEELFNCLFKDEKDAKSSIGYEEESINPKDINQ